jgi:hypothetical protein
MTHRLDAATASRFASAALGHVAREYPNKMDHVMSGPEDVQGPRALHPVFFGSFDWHSCVHGWWTLFTLLRLYPDMPEAGRIRALADEMFTPANVAVETAYLDNPASRGFERPYGWAWLLMLAAELERHRRRAGGNPAAPDAGLRETVHRLPAAGRLSGAGRNPLQHRLRPEADARLRRGRGRRGTDRSVPGPGVALALERPRLSGMGAVAGRVPVAGPDGGRADAAGDGP